jgi:DNA-directed RNA polymerase omega subunit
MELPDVEELIESAGSKYSLCIIVSKRAKDLGEYISARKKMERINVIHPLVDIETDDPMEIAFSEMKEGKISSKIGKDSAE